MQASEPLDNTSKSLDNSASRNDLTAPTATAEPPLPRRFERYTLLKRLARGGMGEVLLAATGGIEGAERPVVVKIIRREHETDKSFLARFLDEARIQAQLQHPGVAQVLEATSDVDGKPFVVVEHVEGRNLSDVRSRAAQLNVRISWPEAIALGITLGEALAHVHERTGADGRALEIVHRDLSPQNVMVSYGGELKLIDFGTARAENRRCHTVAGIVFAKPGYVAPEVANNTPGGVPADLYAFGIILWELLAGRRFLVGESSQHMALVGAGKRNPSPLSQLIGAPAELDPIIARLTATRLEDRYDQAAKAVSDLGRLLQRAPSMADGDRSVRSRVANLMRRLYPAEPARSRAEFARLLAEFRAAEARPLPLPPSPEPPAAEAVDPAILKGTPYKLLGEIGRGAMGVVHQAYHLDLYRTVALKLLHPDTLSPRAVEGFRAEARSIAQLSHENLIELFDFGVTEEGRPFYAMELLCGKTLEKRLAEGGPLEYREAVSIAVQACRALEVAHGAGVVHRDIKPGNLFLTDTGVVKLFDFGVATSSGNVSGGGEAREAIHVVGTPEYMAPEQARGGAADARSDLYSLGVVLYELITGRRPHEASSLVDLIEKKRSRPVLPPSLLRPSARLPKSLERTLLALLAADPAERPRSARELLEALGKSLLAPPRRPLLRRAVTAGLVSVMSLGVLGVGGAALAKTPLGASALAAGRTRFAQASARLGVLRERALARHALPEAATASRQIVAVVVTPEPSEIAGPPGSMSEREDVAKLESQVKGDTVQSAEGSLAADDGEVSEAELEPAAREGAAVGSALAELAPPSEEDAAASQQAEASRSTSGHGMRGVIAESEALWARGVKSRAFGLLKRAAERAPNDAALQRAFSERAAERRSWGDAVRAARRFAELEPSVEARVNLARLERATGHRKRALALVEGVLKQDPGSAEAKSLLGDLRATQKLALAE